MKYKIRMSFIASLFLLSCSGNSDLKDKTVAKNADTLVESFQNDDEIIEPEASTSELRTVWNYIPKMRDSISELIKTNPKVAGKELKKFLISFSKYSDQIEKALQSNKEIYVLDKLVNSNTKSLNPKEKEVAERIKSSGFKVEATEGDPYLEMDEDVLKSFLPVLNGEMLAYWKLNTNEIDQKCCDDGGILLTDKELVRRTVDWRLMTHHKNCQAFDDEIMETADRYMELLCYGTDNSPAFDSETGLFRKELFDLMEVEVKKHAKTDVAHLFNVYFSELIDNRTIPY